MVIVWLPRSRVMSPSPRRRLEVSGAATGPRPRPAAGVRRHVAEDDLVAAGRSARRLVDDLQRPGVGLRVAGGRDGRGELERQRLRGAEVVEILDGDRQQSPSAPAWVSVAGRLALRSIIEVACTATDERLICIGTSPDELSRGCGATSPLRSAGQPISTSPDGVRR